MKRSPFKGRPTPAFAYPFPLGSVNDYEVASGFSGTAGIPVLLSFAEHYELLSKLVKWLKENMPDLEVILMRIPMPTGARLTADLLIDTVFICEDLESQQQKLKEKGRRFMTIRDRFIRHPQEQGDNTIEIKYYAPSSDDGALTQLVEFLRTQSIDKLT